MDSSLHPDVDVLDRPYCHLTDRPLGIDPAFLAQLLGEPSQVRLTLSGYPELVNREILNLHQSGYDIDAWSQPQRIPGSVEVVTAYIKRSHPLA